MRLSIDGDKTEPNPLHKLFLLAPFALVSMSFLLADRFISPREYPKFANTKCKYIHFSSVCVNVVCINGALSIGEENKLDGIKRSSKNTPMYTLNGERSNFFAWLDSFPFFGINRIMCRTLLDFFLTYFHIRNSNNHMRRSYPYLQPPPLSLSLPLSPSSRLALYVCVFAVTWIDFRRQFETYKWRKALLLLLHCYAKIGIVLNKIKSFSQKPS